VKAGSNRPASFKGNMSSYCTLEDLENYIPAETIKQMTDDFDSDDISSDKVNYAITRASAKIDSKLLGRYPVPLSLPVPDQINEICVKLSAYYLYKRSLITTIPEVITQEYKFAQEDLHDIQKGILSPFPISQNPVWFVSNKSKGSRPLGARVTSGWRDYLLRATPGADLNQRFENPGSL
jgi:phage gp36-like protein